MNYIPLKEPKICACCTLTHIDTAKFEDYLDSTDGYDWVNCVCGSTLAVILDWQPNLLREPPKV